MYWGLQSWMLHLRGVSFHRLMLLPRAGPTVALGSALAHAFGSLLPSPHGTFLSFLPQARAWEACLSFQQAPPASFNADLPPPPKATLFLTPLQGDLPAGTSGWGPSSILQPALAVQLFLDHVLTSPFHSEGSWWHCPLHTSLSRAELCSEKP